MTRYLFLLIVPLSPLLIACAIAATPAPSSLPPQQATVVIESTVLVPGPTVVATQVVEVTAPPAEVNVDHRSDDPTTLVVLSFGDATTFDPALAYDGLSLAFMNQVYETLIVPNRLNGTEFVPQLAEALPEVSADGRTYTFTIREGIRFHGGGDLTAEDVAYTFQRNMLQGGYSSPQLLLTEPLLGAGIYDVSELLFRDDPEGEAKMGDPAAVNAADPDALLSVCETVRRTVRAEGNRVTFELAQPWAPFLATLVGGWGMVMDREWVIENGGWDGDCATWQNHYGLMPENDPFTAIMNGTGPYRLERWTPGEEIILAANEAYWRAEETGPVWEGAPTGVAAIRNIVYLIESEWGTMFARMVAGDADIINVPSANYSQMEAFTGEICTWQPETYDYSCAPSATPEQPFRLLTGRPTIGRGDLLFNWAVNAELDNPNIGSGRLDGDGIPPDFFSDVHVRRGFNYCFNWDQYIADYHSGEAIQNVGVVLVGNLGYDPDGPRYSYDPERCADELAQAWGGVLPETGFRLRFVTAPGRPDLETMVAILQANLALVSENYVLELVTTGRATYVGMRENNMLPIVPGGWGEDYHDPHNWVQPHLVGIFTLRTNFPEALIAEMREQVDAAVSTTDPAERQRLYEALNEFDYENALAIRGVVETLRDYRQRWLRGNFTDPYMYVYWKE